MYPALNDLCNASALLPPAIPPSFRFRITYLILEAAFAHIFLYDSGPNFGRQGRQKHRIVAGSLQNPQQDHKISDHSAIRCDIKGPGSQQRQKEDSSGLDRRGCNSLKLSTWIFRIKYRDSNLAP